MSGFNSEGQHESSGGRPSPRIGTYWPDVVRSCDLTPHYHEYNPYILRCLMFAATDTTSGVMARILHILAENPDVQDRLRKEIVNARQASGGDLDYNRLQDLPYLDAVIRETLRL